MPKLLSRASMLITVCGALSGCDANLPASNSSTVDADIIGTSSALRDAPEAPAPAPDTSSNLVSQARRNASVQIVGCSATLITPRLAVTAGHCVDNNGLNIPHVRFDPNRGTGPTVEALGCFLNPHYADLDCIGGCPATPPPTAHTPEHDRCSINTISGLVRVRHDMAVVALAERVEMNRARPSAWRTSNVDVIPARPSFDFVPPNTTVRYVGYASESGSTRNFINTTIENYHDASLAWLEGAMFSGGDLFIGGDSGGSVLLGNPDNGTLAYIGNISGSCQDTGCKDFWCDCFWYNRSHSAPISHPGNVAWLGQFLNDMVDQPGVIDTPIYLGDWDLPLRGEPERNAPEYAALRALDRDGDGLIDEHDNCPTVYNPEQRDSAGANGVDVRLDGVADFADCMAIPIAAAIL